MNIEIDKSRVRYVLSNLPHSGFIWQPFIIVVVFLVIGFIPLFPDPDADGQKVSLPVFKWIALATFIFALVFNYAFKGIYKRKSAIFPKAQVRKTIEEGSVEDALVLHVVQDHSIKRGSIHTPLSVIIMKMEDDGSQAQFGMFEKHAFGFFERGSKIKALRHKDTPDLAIPLELLTE